MGVHFYDLAMFARVRVCVCAYVRDYARAGVRVWVSVFACACVHAKGPASVREFVCACACWFGWLVVSCVCACVRVCVSECVLGYVHTCSCACEGVFVCA